MSEYIIIADFFANEISGGGELNNEELYKLLKKDHNGIKFATIKFASVFLFRKSGVTCVLFIFITL